MSFRLLLVVCVACVLGRAATETTPPEAAVPLQAIAADPGRVVPLQFAADFSFAQNREAFDGAFAACRKALQADAANTGTRANLGALYLYRDKFHPEESGNLEKGINQFLIVLRDDPGNTIVPTYFDDHDLLTGVRAAMAEPGMDRIRSALQQSWGDAQNEASLRACARVCLFDGHLTEARDAIEKLVATSDDASAQRLLGALELKTDHAGQALAAFRSAGQKTGDAAEATVAKLGAAQALITLGHLDEADSLLDAATSAPSPEALAHAARTAEILTPTELQWELGKALARAGEIDRAVGYIGSQVGEILSDKAVKAWDGGNKQEALDTFLQLLELEPDKGEIYLAVALLSFDLKRYRDAVWAFHEGENHDEKLSKNMLIRLGISHLALAEYRKACAAFDAAHRLDESDSGVRGWRVGAAFAVGGWQHALETLQSAPPLDPRPQDFNEERRRTYDLAYGIICDAENRAKEAGLRYPLLSHLSLHNELLSTFVPWSSGDTGAALRKEKWSVVWEAIDLYRTLPLKPRPPARAIAKEAMAENLVRQGKIGYDAEHAGCAAVEIAPWWPEARYNLGVYARDSYFSINFADRYVDSGAVSWNNEQSAAQEFLFYLNLAPNGAKAAEVRQQLRTWKVAIPSSP